jgi:outer membrane lipoprotein LolB
MRLQAAALLALTALVLAGCATPRVATTPGRPPDLARRATLQALAGYDFRGQLAAAAGDQGFSATLNWQQRESESRLQLRGPLGMGNGQLSFGALGLSYTGSDGKLLAGDAAHAALAQLLGFEPPIASLRYWLLAVPDPAAPADEQADARGLPLALMQSGWRVDYSEFQPAGTTSLPGRVTLQRGALRLRLRIAQWQLP